MNHRKLLTLAVCALLSQGSARAATQGADPLAPLLNFARQHPGDIAVFTATLDAQGQPDPRFPQLSWNADQPMPLASTRKILILAAYARAVAQGTLRPETTVSVAEWERYALPGTDGGAHLQSLQALGLAANAQGLAQTPQQTVTLDTLARFMIETSDNAAADLLLTRLGPEALAATQTAFGLNGQEPLSPILGLFGNWFAPQASLFVQRPLAERTALNWTTARRLSTDAGARLMLAWATGPSVELQQRLTDTTDTRGTVNDYVRLMSGVLAGTLYRPAEREVMARHLGWPMRVHPGNAEVFERLYAKGGSLPGVLTNTFAFEPKVGPHTGKALVVSVFLRRIPDTQYEALSEQLDTSLLLLSTSPAQAQRLLDVLKAR